ncbi:MAG: protein rep, partial [bacterium]|nr:protein rep [bacterium]
DRRRMAHVLRRFNRGLLVSDYDLRSIARCGNALGSTVMFRKRGDGRVRPGGVATCKSVWGCLGCAARRRALKSAMVKYYVDAHLDAGKGVSFGSFTLAHYASDNLADLLEGLRKAFTDMRHLKVYKEAEQTYGVIGWIAALEITHGANGWHPHLHVLFFHDRHLDLEFGENAGFRAARYESFARQIDRHLG